MGFDIIQMFPKTERRSKAEILARVAALKKSMVRPPQWMIASRKRSLVGCVYPKNFKNIPFEFTRNYYERGPHDYQRETRKSSEVDRTNIFVVPKKETGIDVFQLFRKSKERIDIKQVWEHLMLDLWSHLLRRYSQACQITLRAPQSFKLEGNSLYMAYCGGTIGDRLHMDFDPDLEVVLPSGALPLYHAFARHLGALAHVKETEELLHGDYQLRHLLFDPGGLINNFFYYIRANKIFEAQLTGRTTPFLVDGFFSRSSLSVIDIEHGLRQPEKAVREENEALLTQARNYSTSQGLKPAVFEQSYRDGYDMIRPQGIIQEMIDQQYERCGVSVDNLF